MSGEPIADNRQHTEKPLAEAERDPSLEARLLARLQGRRVLAFRSVPSTMDVASALAARGAPHGTLVWAERQSQGRGRQGRRWESPAGGAYFSLVLRPTRPAVEVPQLSLVAGLSAVEAIHEQTGLSTVVRWPNDILLNGRKLAGILIEGRSEAAILGVGMNVTTAPKQLPDTATSLRIAGARDDDPYRLTGTFIGRFQIWYTAWETAGFSPIRAALRPWMGMFGQPVRITTGAGEVQGTASDLDGQGRLLVRLDAGVLRALDMGDVTLLS